MCATAPLTQLEVDLSKAAKDAMALPDQWSPVLPEYHFVAECFPSLLDCISVLARYYSAHL